MFRTWKPGGKPLTKIWWTGADWLFAYWIARVSGELVPVVGAGREPRKHPCEIDYPAWMPK